MRVRFAGTVRSSLTCRPAPSRTSAAWVPAGTARDSSARKTSMAAVETSGRTKATPLPRSGHTAPNRWAEAKPCCRTPRGRTPFLVPDVGEAALLADPRLVHEPQLDPLGLGVPVRRLPHHAGQGFLNRSCALGSASGWIGLVFCHERSRPLSSFSIPLSP